MIAVLNMCLNIMSCHFDRREKSSVYGSFGSIKIDVQLPL